MSVKEKKHDKMRFLDFATLYENYKKNLHIYINSEKNQQQRQTIIMKNTTTNQKRK